MDNISIFRLFCSIIFGLTTIYLLVKPSADGKYNITSKAWIAIIGVALTLLTYDASQPKEFKENYHSAPSQTGSGSCDYDWQKAKDGSKCGDRAANKKPGGY